VDNLVQIGHNVQTGHHCLIISQTGIAGSAQLGNRVVLAGQVGVKDHLTIGGGAQAAAQSCVWGNLPAGAVVSGSPDRPHREQVRLQAALGQLPELLRRVQDLERRLADTPPTPQHRLPQRLNARTPERPLTPVVVLCCSRD
jgi:UDP-3-O-[3-hydroxymyristoyl] glucosamine N-acyltransferase